MNENIKRFPNWLFLLLEDVGFEIKDADYFFVKKDVVHTERGLYFFIRKDVITYIGITHDMKDRINKHRKYEGEEILFFPAGKIKDARLKQIEHGLQLLIQPAKNPLHHHLNTRSKA